VQIQVIPVAGDWKLAVDFGTAFTAAAVAEDNAITDVAFGGCPVLPSAVALDAAGQILTGWEALDWGRTNPHSVLRQPKREVSAGAKVRLDGTTVLVADVVVAVLNRILVEEASRRSGRPPSDVVFCHPATWTGAESGEISAAAAARGIPGLSFVAEPLAAAMHYFGGCPAPGCAQGGSSASGAGELVICDFGAGLGVTVIRRSDGLPAIAGRPSADDEFGGDDLDERMMDLLADRAYEADPRLWDSLTKAQPEPTAELALVRSRVTHARETLSSLLHTDIAVPGYGASFRVTRREFEAAAKQDFERMVALTETAITLAGLTPTGLSAVALAGAVSRTPAVSDVLATRLSVLPWMPTDPKVPVAHGALLTGIAGAASAAGETTRPSVGPQHYRVFDPDNDDWLNT